jgi:hypothetical protein
MSGKKDHINYTLADIEAYLQGRLSPAAMHAMEKAALQDPFLADALEGFRSVDTATARADLAAIETQITAAEQTGTIPAAANPGAGWWKIAASVILVAGAAIIGWYTLRPDNSRQEIAQQITPIKNIRPDSPIQNKVLPTAPKEIVIKKQKQAQQAEDAARDISIRQQREAELADTKTLMAAEKQKKELLPPPVPETLSTANQQSFTGPNARVFSGKMSGVSVTSPTRLQSFSGVIIDSNRAPIANASILLEDKQGVAADDKGRYSFKTRDTVQIAEVTALGFKPKKLELSALKSGKITLDANNNELNEVVVIGYGTQRKSDITGSVMTLPKPADDMIRPAIGWTALFVYMDSSVQKYRGQRKYRYTAKAPPLRKVMVELILDESGIPSKVTILNSFDSAGNIPPIDRLKIDALKKGPSWQNTDGSLATGTKKITLHFVAGENP